MDHLIPFPGGEELPDPEKLDLEELLCLLEDLNDQLTRLDDCEPEGMEGEVFEAWADRHEWLEDLLDDVLDRIDELS